MKLTTALILGATLASAAPALVQERSAGSIASAATGVPIEVTFPRYKQWPKHENPKRQDNGEEKYSQEILEKIYRGTIKAVEKAFPNDPEKQAGILRVFRNQHHMSPEPPLYIPPEDRKTWAKIPKDLPREQWEGWVASYNREVARLDRLWDANPEGWWDPVWCEENGLRIPTPEEVTEHKRKRVAALAALDKKMKHDMKVKFEQDLKDEENKKKEMEKKENQS
jgi:hypothetical protein